MVISYIYELALKGDKCAAGKPGGQQLLWANKERGKEDPIIIGEIKGLGTSMVRI